MLWSWNGPSRGTGTSQALIYLRSLTGGGTLWRVHLHSEVALSHCRRLNKEVGDASGLRPSWVLHPIIHITLLRFRGHRSSEGGGGWEAGRMAGRGLQTFRLKTMKAYSHGDGGGRDRQVEGRVHGK